MAKKRANRAMPTWIKGDKTTKSGGGKIKTTIKKTGGVRGFRPGDTSLKAVFNSSKEKK